MTVAYVGLGSNLGDRMGLLRAAVAALDARAGVRVLRASAVYETEPVGPPQPRFLNAVVELDTTLPPRELLGVLKAVEGELGRRPSVRWGPREVDCDLLLYGQERIEEPGLVVPHPELARRAFVLVPLADLAPGLQVPGAGRVADLVAAVAHGQPRPVRMSSSLLPSKAYDER